MRRRQQLFIVAFAAVLAVAFCIIDNGKVLAAATPPSAIPERRKNVRRSITPSIWEPASAPAC